MKPVKFLSISLLVASFLLVVGCSKDTTSSTNQGQLVLHLIDSPANYDAVYLVVSEVAVHSNTDGWVVINDSLRTFDLLTLVNGASAILGKATLNPGHYTQIRLMLVDSCKIVVDGVTYPLTVPSEMQSGYKLTNAFDIQSDYTYELLLDFAAAQSINELGNGLYKLNPVIRVHPVALTGAISGIVMPLSTKPIITAILGIDTATTFTNEITGAFKLMALPAGAYSVQIASSDTLFRDTTITGVSVSIGQTTPLGTITLNAK